MVEIPGSEKIKYQENQRDDAIVDTIPQKRICRGGEKFEMTAKEDKCGHMPAHNEHADGNTNKSEAKYGNISKVFRCEKKGVSTIIFHESSVNRGKKNKPEYKQNLVPPEMKEQ